MKHPHAELMMQYAQDAMETDKPWERWEFLNLNKTNWRQLSMNPSWYKDYEYRRKPRTIHINGFEVPEPVREPLKLGQEYWFPNLWREILVYCETWSNSHYELMALNRGQIHLDKKAAILHAKALLSFTERKE